MRLMIATLMLACLTALSHGVLRNAAPLNESDPSAMATAFTGQ